MTDSKPHASIVAIGENIGRLITGHIELAFRRILSGPGVSLDPRFVRLETGAAHPFGNFACLHTPADEDSAGAAIEPLIRRNAPAAVLVAGAVSEPIVQQLTGAGFQRAGGMPAMAVDIDRTLVETSLPAGYTFERVIAVADCAKWADAFERGYGIPPPVGAALARGIDGNASAAAPLQYFWILKNGAPVCTSLVCLDNGVAGIYCVATLPEERKKGLGAHATAQPLRIAGRLGYRVGVLQASAEGHPVYRRMGFADCGEVPLFIRMPL